MATEFRRYLEIPPHARINGVALFEKLDELTIEVMGRPIPVDYAVKLIPDPALLGFTYFNAIRGSFETVLSHETYSELQHKNGRALFTLAHELGHLAMHGSELVQRSRFPLGLSRSANYSVHEVYYDTEWQADVFAGAFLAPLAALDHLHDMHLLLTAQGLMSEFGLSRTAARIRLQDVKKMTGDRYRIYLD